MLRSGLMLPVLLALALVLGGCSDFSYYSQCVLGHVDLLAKRQQITTLIADPATADDLRQILKRVVVMRDFASQQLGLPDNASYRSYADVGRPYVVWNVVAAPEFSLTPKQWCFPVVGCVSYRGYFKEQAAREQFELLQQQGFDAYLYGVPAYSTLQWFDDPVLNTFCRQPGPYVAGMIFHELAHQVVYIKDDSNFNEAFAKTVELEGVRRWLEQEGQTAEALAYETDFHRNESVVKLIMESREQLRALYASGLEPAVMRERKAELLAELTAKYRELQQQWPGYRGYEKWFASGLNNAKLASISTYRAEVPAFQQLLRELNHDLPAFYRAAEALGNLPEQRRKDRLAELAAAAQKQESGAKP